MEGSKLHTSHKARPGQRLTAIAVVTLLLTALVGVVGSAPAGAAVQTSVIDFESGLAPGDLVSTLSVGNGMTGANLGAVSVVGSNPGLPGNTAMIFDSTCGGQSVPFADLDRSLCSGGDWDIYLPSLGQTLIITEDFDSSDPDDEENHISDWTFDFSAWGTGVVTVNRLTTGDVNPVQTGLITFFDSNGAVITTVPVPTSADAEATTITPGVAGVGSMIVDLGGSGIVDNIEISGEAPLIDVELDKTASPAAVPVGGQTTFTVTLVNQGPNDATGVVVQDRLPAGLTYVSHSGDGTFDSTTGLWTIGDAPVGVTYTLDMVVVVEQEGTYTNVAEVMEHNEVDRDSTPGNNVPSEDDQDDATVTASQPIDIELTKSVNVPEDEKVPVDSDVTFTVTVTNEGPAPATGVVVQDRLPAGLTYVSHSGDRSFDAGAFVWTIGDLGVNETVTLDLVVTVTDIGIFTNVAEVMEHNEFDIDSTPGNDVLTEDDQDDASVESIAVQASSTIGDFVWFDDDQDGIQDAGEDGVPGVTVRLTNQATSEVSTMVTNANGLYLFSGLDAGTYFVEVLTSTFPDNHNLTTVGNYTVTLQDDESFLDADFGIVEVLPITGMEIEAFAVIGVALLYAGGLLLALEHNRRRRLLPLV
ncbi:MAG: SdrD B-like domain-containing protein [Acidimicrobiia bacterium]|nr:SdrD B-like domain-containing protein [Acidimicrobiia bacterium]